MALEDFDQLYAEHAQGLFAFLVYRTGDRALAEDLVADTFERVLRARRRFNPRRGTAKSWIYSIALNLLRDQLRRRGAEERALARRGLTDEADDRSLEPVETRDQVNRALQALSEKELEAVALRFGAELTGPEMADVLGEGLATVEGRLYRALRKLRSDLS